MKTESKVHKGLLSSVCVSIATFLAPALSLAQESLVAGDAFTEEIVVTAQRVPESIQDVPIAMDAFSANVIENRQIINPSDLQLNIPSMNFTANNFGGSSMTIRGIGSIVVGSSGESGISTHVDEVALPMNLNTEEFFDMERVEVLHGPQGTLYGRNATGGAVNFVTQKPEVGVLNGSLDTELGSYNHIRTKGIWNVPLGKRVALRFAGMWLKRDGYTENLAYGQTNADGKRLPEIDESIDGRDINSGRISLVWGISDRLNLRLKYTAFHEDDDRARITNQICKRNAIPTTGCLPNEFGLETVHVSAHIAGLFTGLNGLIPLGTDGSDLTMYDYPRPEMSSLREVHTDFDPIFKESSDSLSYRLQYDMDKAQLSVIGVYLTGDHRSLQDYQMDVGIRFGEFALNPGGLWPVSAPAGQAGDDFRADGRCNILEGTGGLAGGCIYKHKYRHAFGYDQSDTHLEYRLVEAKLNTVLNGSWNYLGGVIFTKNTRNTDYQIFLNGLDMVASYGVPSLGSPPLYPGYFTNATHPNNGIVDDGYSVFGETYYDVHDDLKITVGLRFNSDNRSRSDTSVLFDAISHLAIVNQVLAGIKEQISAATGIPVAFIPDEAAVQTLARSGVLDPSVLENLVRDNAYWSRTRFLLMGPLCPVIGCEVPEGALESERRLADHYGVSAEQWDMALRTPAYSRERIAISSIVGAAAGFGESRALTGSPSSVSYEQFSGRAGFHWELNEDQMIYAFVSQGYKPGGLNAAIPVAFQHVSSFDYGPEEILAYEVGTKNLLRLEEGDVQLNGAVFFYNYTGMQTTRIRNNSSITENIDATITGFEVDSTWTFTSMPGLVADASYTWLNAEVGDSSSIDPINRTGNNPDYVLLNNLDVGAGLGINYIAKASQITNELIAAAAAKGATLHLPHVLHPPNAQGVAIPSYFSRQFLVASGIEVMDGIPIHLEGNRLPASPEHAFKIGSAYSLDVGWLDGMLTVRGDYMWQSEIFSREFNTKGDRIEAWGQLNASVIFESGNGRVTLKGWIRNVLDDENVTGMYLTSDTSGFFRNYFLTEPRIFGVSGRYNFGI